MSRDFISNAIGRAMHEEIFRQLWQNDARAAADAMEMTYDPDDLRIMEGIRLEMENLDSQAARDYLMELSQQPQDVYGGPQRFEE